MDIFQTYKEKIISICKNIFDNADAKIYEPITAEPPKDSSHGDIATNAAMVLAKPLGQNPRVIAEKLAAELKKDPSIEKADIAGPGFINLKLKNSVWLEVIKNVLDNPAGFSKSNLGKGKNINIEYVSPNPTGPMHIGHARNAVIGDVLASILIANGYNVTKECYINDAGAQVNILAESAFLRYKEACGENIGEIPKGLYPGEYLIEVVQKFKDKYGEKFKNDKKYPQELKSFAIKEMLEVIRQDLSALNVKHDVFSSEAELHKKNALENSIKYLESKGLVYRGILEPPKGKTPEDWEPR